MDKVTDEEIRKHIKFSKALNPHTWTCPECGKQIQSLYPKQIIALAKEHMEKHEKVSK